MRRTGATLLGFTLLAGCWPNSHRPLTPEAANPLPDAVVQAPLPTENSSPYQAKPIARPITPPPQTQPQPHPEPEPPPPPQPLTVRPASHAKPELVLTPLKPTENPGLRRVPTEPAVVEALRCLLEKRPADAITPLEKLDKPTQDLLLRFLPVIARLNEGSIEKSDPEDLAIVAGQLEEVVRTLQPRAALVVDTMCFCRRIDKFGQYDPLPADYRFKSGEMVLTYVELRNFSCRQVDDFYETRLASSVEIQDAQNRTVWRQDLNDRDRPDKSRSLRSDYCNGYRFCIPENIPPGVYRLVLRVSDVLLPERKPAERSLVLRVTTRPLAESRGNR